jgi:uncharacterized protein YciI
MRWLSAALLSLPLACGSALGDSAPVCPDPQPTIENEPPSPTEPQPVSFELPAGMRVYTIVLLRRGPNWSDKRDDEALELGAGHMAYIREMSQTGQLTVAGPFLGQQDREDLAGIYIYESTSVEETKKLVAEDPAVSAGRFSAEYLLWLSPEGLRTNPSKAASPETPACQGEPQRGFDFWLGQWMVTTGDGTLAGHNRIERAHGGCAVLEHWKSANGGSGTSTNYYDPGKKLWVQNWVDASGSIIQLEGGLSDGSMVLEGRYVKADGTHLRMRGTWTPLEDGRVRQFFETQAKGESWTPWFEGFYVKQN